MRYWIRADVPVTENEYHEFLHTFDASGGKGRLFISSETDYCAFLNGKAVGYGQYHDLPSYKVYDEYEVSLRKGKNVLAVVAYFGHTPTASYVEKGLGLLFSVEGEGGILCESGKRTLSRPSRVYESGTGVPLITGQLGYSYRCDLGAEDGWVCGEGEGFLPSQEICEEGALNPRPVQKLKEHGNVSRAIRAGSWKFCGGETAAERMQLAELSERPAGFALPDKEGVAIEGERVYLLCDLGEEKTGILTFDIEVPAACGMCVAYGEHIADGRVRSYISGRNFSFEFKLKAGRNRFTGPFRRLGGRYISLFLDAPRAVVYDFNVISTDYPVTEKKRTFADARLQQIYDTCVRTLKVCMHEHYEDTPWREQALYAMDSRNQMLCGYFAFEGYSFARASLHLLSENLRADGFFTLTSPKSLALGELTIPCFSLVQFCAMEEYARYAGDISLFEQHAEKYRTVMRNFLSRREKNGLLKAIKGLCYWNFYEWAEGMEGNFLCEAEDRYEAPLNAFLILALRSYIALLRRAGTYGGEYDADLAGLISAFEAFYDGEKGCWADFMSDGGGLSHYSELTNSLAVLVSGERERAARAAELLSGPSFLGKITLNHSIFKFEALLHADKERYAACVLGEIRAVWGKMLDEGATTFYEEAAGEKAFNRAGSLSHGWSAVPAYILCKLFYPQEVKE